MTKVNKHSIYNLVIGLGVFLLMGACNQAETSNPSIKEKQDRWNAKLEAEKLLLSDPERAVIELEQRLMQSVSVQEGIIVLRNPMIGRFMSSYFSANTPWQITCGAGFKITFGHSVTVDGRENWSTNDFQNSVYLSYAIIDQNSCAILGPRIGRRIEGLLKREQTS